MPRPRTPTATLELRGSFDKNPQRRRGKEPQPDGEIGEPPERMTNLQAQAWAEIVENCASGVLTNMDRLTLELICMSLAECWDGTANSTDRDRVFRQLGKLGMTPSERAVLAVAAPKLDRNNPFARLDETDDEDEFQVL